MINTLYVPRRKFTRIKLARSKEPSKEGSLCKSSIDRYNEKLKINHIVNIVL